MLASPGHQVLGVVQVLVQAGIVFDAQQQHGRARLEAPVAVVAALVTTFVGLVAVVPAGAGQVLVPVLQE
jgi:proline racemase